MSEHIDTMDLKDGVVNLSLKAKSGYAANVEAKISANQWGDLIRVCNDELSSKKSPVNLQARIDELEMICASAYQVVGVLLNDTGRFDDEDGIKALDMLSEMKYDDTVLPFESKNAKQN